MYTIALVGTLIPAGLQIIRRRLIRIYHEFRVSILSLGRFRRRTVRRGTIQLKI